MSKEVITSNKAVIYYPLEDLCLIKTKEVSRNILKISGNFCPPIENLWYALEK